MVKENSRESDIWRETGWEKGKDGLWRFEIDDYTAKIKETFIKNVKKLDDVIDFPELFRQYPQIKDFPIVYGGYDNPSIIDKKEMSLTTREYELKEITPSFKSKDLAFADDFIMTQYIPLEEKEKREELYKKELQKDLPIPGVYKTIHSIVW